MKGLLVKEFYILKGTMKQFFLILVFFWFWMGGLLKNTTMFSVMTVMYFAMLTLTSMSYDETAQFYKYELTLPVSRKELVRSKFLLLQALSVTGMVIGICGSVIMHVFQSGMKTTLVEDCITAVAAWCIFSIAFSVMLPIVFRLGIEKARLCLLVVYIGIFGLVFGLYWMAERLHLPFTLTEQSVIYLTGGGVALSVVLYLIFYLVALRIVMKKEW